MSQQPQQFVPSPMSVPTGAPIPMIGLYDAPQGGLQARACRRPGCPQPSGAFEGFCDPCARSVIAERQQALFQQQQQHQQQQLHSQATPAAPAPVSVAFPVAPSTAPFSLSNGGIGQQFPHGLPSDYPASTAVPVPQVPPPSRIDSAPIVTGACLTSGCDLFGSTATMGYCSRCYAAARNAAPAPVPALAVAGAGGPASAYSSSSSSSHSDSLAQVVSASTPCAMPGCDLFGRPETGNMCSRCFAQASPASVAPPAPISLAAVPLASHADAAAPRQLCRNRPAHFPEEADCYGTPERDHLCSFCWNFQLANGGCLPQRLPGPAGRAPLSAASVRAGPHRLFGRHAAAAAPAREGLIVYSGPASPAAQQEQLSAVMATYPPGSQVTIITTTSCTSCRKGKCRRNSKGHCS